MNVDEKIKRMDLWIKLFFIMAHVMVVIALSTFVWGETDEDGGLVGLGGDVAVASIVVMGLMILGMMLIIFTGLYLRATQYIGEDG